MFFGTTTLLCLVQSFLMSLFFTRGFVHLAVIEALCHFSVYKLIGWDPENIYLVRKKHKKKVKICPK